MLKPGIKTSFLDSTNHLNLEYPIDMPLYPNVHDHTHDAFDFMLNHDCNYAMNTYNLLIMFNVQTYLLVGILLLHHRIIQALLKASNISLHELNIDHVAYP